MLMFFKMAEKKHKKKNKEDGFVIELEIPKDEGIEITAEKGEVHIKKDGKEAKRRFSGAVIEKHGDKIIVKTKRSTKREKKVINTIVAHIKNMIKGLKENFEYKLQICAVHFPMSVEVKGREVIVKNFLGETKERKAKIIPGVEVKIERDIITVSSSNKEHAGQTAANIEKSAQIKDKDRRIFQDGIFITEKSGNQI